MRHLKRSLNAADKLVLILLCITLVLRTQCANAGGVDNLLKWSKSGDSMVSINQGAVISDQRAGYLTGGSIIVRGPKPEILQPLVIQPPSFAFDACSGSFDARFGGFSFIKGEQFASFFKSVASSAGAYAAKMAIKQVCPQCEDIMSYLESVARDINGRTINQCSLSQTIAQGGLAIMNNADKQKCMMQSNVTRGSSDMYEATQSCIDNPDRFGEIEEDGALKSLLGDNFNLVWKALSQGNSATPNDLKEMMMSITGSVIGSKNSGSIELSILPSLIEKEDLLERYIGKPGVGSSTVKLYECDEVIKCLHPVEKDVVLNNQSDTLYGKVHILLQSIFVKIDRNEGTLTDEEQALIEFCQIPLINLMEMELATKNKDSAHSLIGMSEFIEVVCYDVVVNFMVRMVKHAKNAVEILQSAQLDNTVIDRFTHNIEVVQGYLRDKRFESMQKLEVITQVKERLKQQQSVFQIEFGRFLEARGK